MGPTLCQPFSGRRSQDWDDRGGLVWSCMNIDEKCAFNLYLSLIGMIPLCIQVTWEEPSKNAANINTVAVDQQLVNLMKRKSSGWFLQWNIYDVCAMYGGAYNIYAICTRQYPISAIYWTRVARWCNEE